MKASVIERGSALNKALSVLMALVLAVSLAPLPAYAETPGESAPEQEQQLDPAPETPGEPVVEKQGEPVEATTVEPEADAPVELKADSPAKPATTPVEPEADSSVELVGASSSSPAEQVNTTVPELAATSSANPATRTFTDAATSIKLEVTANDAATAAALESAVLQVKTVDQISNAEAAKAAFAAQAGEDATIELYEIKLMSNGADLALAAADTATITLPADAQSTVWGYREGQVVKLESTQTDGKTTARAQELGLIAVAVNSDDEKLASDKESEEAQVELGALEIASTGDALTAGVYSVNANLTIYGQDNAVLPGLQVYPTSENFPPADPNYGLNATLEVSENGEMTLMLPLNTDSCRRFTVQSVASGNNTEVVETPWGDPQNYGTVLEGDGAGTAVSTRITHIKFKMKDSSGVYDFSSCKQFVTLFGKYYEMPMHVLVDFSSANRNYVVPDEGQASPSYSKTYTDGGTGVSVSVNTTEVAIGSKLDAATLTVTKDDSISERAKAVIENSYSSKPTITTYSIALRDSSGNNIDTTGNTEVVVKFPSSASKRGEIWKVTGDEATYVRNTTLADGRAVRTTCGVSYDNVMGTFVLVNGDSTYRWVEKDWSDSSTGVDSRLRMSTYAVDWYYDWSDGTQQLNDAGPLMARLSVNSSTDGFAPDNQAKAYRIAAAGILTDPRLCFIDSNGKYQSELWFSLPASSSDQKVYFVTDYGTEKRIIQMPAAYSNGKLSFNMFDPSLGLVESDVTAPLINGVEAESVSDASLAKPLGYFIVSSSLIASPPVLKSEASGRNPFTNTYYSAQSSLVYTGEEQGLKPGQHVTVTGQTSATNAGTYTAVATPESGYTWIDGTNTPKTISWTIDPGIIRASYVKESINENESPKLEVSLGFELGDPWSGRIDADSIEGLVRPTVELPDGTALTPGTQVSLTPSGGSVASGNWKFYYLPGTLNVNPNVPAPIEFVYDGTKKTVTAGNGWTVPRKQTSGYVSSATEIGEYKVSVAVKSGFAWADGTTANKTVAWRIIAPDKSALQSAIADAQADIDGTKLSVDGSGLEPGTFYIEPDAPSLTKLQETLDSARQLAESATATEASIKDVASALGLARSTFNEARHIVPSDDSVEEVLQPGTYVVTANVWLQAADAKDAGFPILAQIAGADGGAYMTNATNPNGAEGGATGVPTSPVSDNATLVVADDGTCTLTVPIANPVFTMQKLGTNASLGSMSYTTKAGSYGNYQSRIDSITVTLPSAEDATYVLAGSAFHPTILALQYPTAITVPLRLTVGGLGDLPTTTVSDTVKTTDAAITAKGAVTASGSAEAFTVPADLAAKGGATVELVVEDRTAADAAALQKAYASQIGSREVAAVYEVDLEVLNAAGQAVGEKAEGVGALRLTLPVGKLHAGRTVRVVQLHKKASGQPVSEVITYDGLVVGADGTVGFTVKGGKLSEFIVALEPVSAQSGATSGTTGGNAATAGDGIDAGSAGGTAAGAAAAGTVQTTSDGRLAAGTYTVSANIWVNRETSGLPLQPHFTSAAFPPMNPVAGNATLRVDGNGRAYLTVPIVIQSRVMQVRSISGLPIVDYSSSDGGLTSITLDLGVLSASDTVVTRSCTASVHLGDLAASIIGGERDRTWAATFQMNFTGLPSSGGGEVPAAVQAMIDAAGADGRAADADAAAAAAKASALGGLTKNLRPQRAYADDGSADPSAPAQQGSFPWAPVAGGVAVAVIAGVAGYLLGSRRKRDTRRAG